MLCAIFSKFNLIVLCKSWSKKARVQQSSRREAHLKRIKKAAERAVTGQKARGFRRRVRGGCCGCNEAIKVRPDRILNCN